VRTLRRIVVDPTGTRPVGHRPGGAAARL